MFQTPLVCSKLTLTLQLGLFIAAGLALPSRAALVRLAWDPHPDPRVAGYKVYVGRSVGSYDAVHLVTAGTSFDVLDLTAGLTYAFAVSAFTSTGAEGPMSSPLLHTLLSGGGGGDENAAPVALGQSVTITAGTAVNLVLRGSDADGDALSYTVTTPPVNGTLRGIPPSISYTPRSGFSGTDSLRFTVSDGSRTSSAATVSITVVAASGGNQPPTAIDRSLKLPEDTSLAFSLRASDPEGDPLTFKIITAPSKGTLSGTLPNVKYQGRRNYNGPDSIRFTVRDAFSSKLSTGVVSIAVLPVNDAPVATSATYGVARNGYRDFTLKGTDVEGTRLRFAITQWPSSGRITGTVPALRYTPASGFTGTTTLKFTVSDGYLKSAAGTITFNVSSTLSATSASTELDPETTQAEEASLLLASDEILGAAGQGESLLVSGASSVLDNDADDAGAPLAASLATAPRYGLVDLTPEGRFTYRHVSGGVDHDSFRYRATTPDGRSAEAHVWVQFSPQPQLSLGDDQLEVEFPVTAGVSYLVEAQSLSARPSSPWEPMISFTAEGDGLASVLDPLSVVEGGRRYRVAPQTDPAPTPEVAAAVQATVSSETPLPLQRWVRGPVFAGPVIANQQEGIELRDAQWQPSALGVVNGFARHLAVITASDDPGRIGRWWIVQDNTERQLQLAPAPGATEPIALPIPGEVLEITATLDLDSLHVASGLFIDALREAGTLVLHPAQGGEPVRIEAGPDTETEVGFIVQRGDVREGPVPATDIRLLPGDSLRLDPATPETTSLPLWLIGRVPRVPLAR